MHPSTSLSPTLKIGKTLNWAPITGSSMLLSSTDSTTLTRTLSLIKARVSSWTFALNFSENSPYLLPTMLNVLEGRAFRMREPSFSKLTAISLGPPLTLRIRLQPITTVVIPSTTNIRPSFAATVPIMSGSTLSYTFKMKGALLRIVLG